MTQSSLPVNVEARRARAADEVDLTQVVSILRRQWKWLLLAPLALGALTYTLFSRQPKVYEASTSLMSVVPDNSNRVLTGASATAPQLPQGAVAEVLHSRQTVNRIEKLISTSALPAELKTKIARDLKTELSREQYRRIQVKARLDQYQRGVYDLTATAESPESARVLADAATSALLAWDQERARSGVNRARDNIKRQLDNVTRRIQALPAGSVEQQGLISARGQLELDLSQATVFGEGAVGSLTWLKEANAPSLPISPKPKRNAALVFLLSLFAGVGLILLLDALRRKVQNTSDLIGLGIPVLGELPRMRRAQRTNTVQAVRAGDLYEPVGFIRVNLDSAITGRPMILAVSSARPGEGKSTLVAAVAASYAQVGRTVLIIDADMHRPMQQEFWTVGGHSWVPLPGATEPQQTDIKQAIEHPERASAVDLGEGIHLLPTSMVGRHSAGLLSSLGFAECLKTWSTAYDIVIVDTPPVLALADAFIVARQTDGLILVVESGETSLPEVQRVLTNVSTTGTRLLGLVVNKVKRSQQNYYYGYQSESRMTSASNTL